MSDFDDGHSTATCNFRECNAIDPKVPCPFVRDAQLEDADEQVIGLIQSRHDHVWGVVKLRCSCGLEHEL